HGAGGPEPGLGGLRRERRGTLAGNARPETRRRRAGAANCLAPLRQRGAEVPAGRGAGVGRRHALSVHGAPFAGAVERSEPAVYPDGAPAAVVRMAPPGLADRGAQALATGVA